MSDDLYAQITEALLLGDVDKTVGLVQSALTSGLEPMDIINNGLVPGMDIAGERFDRSEFFLPVNYVSHFPL